MTNFDTKFLFVYGLCSWCTTLLAVVKHPEYGPGMVSLHFLSPLPGALLLSLDICNSQANRSDLLSNALSQRPSLTMPYRIASHLYYLSSLFPFPSWYLPPLKYSAYVFTIFLFPLAFKLHKNSNFVLFFSFLCFSASAQNKAWNMGNAA